MAKNANEHIVSMLSEPRFAPFLNATKGVSKNALKLYRWNLNMSSAFHKVLASTEVLLRNAIDRELRSWNKAQKGCGEDWLITQTAAPLTSLAGGEKASAQKKAKDAQKLRGPEHPRCGQAVNHNDVLAQVSFAMWRDLIPNHSGIAADNSKNRGRLILWEESLQNCFPGEADGGKATYWRVIHLYRLRNRVSHMESLLEVDLDARMRDLMALVQSIDREAANWILSEKKEVTDLIEKRESF